MILLSEKVCVATKAENAELMIWTSDGVWFQYVDERGQVRTNYVGRLSQFAVEDFCRQNGLALEVWNETKRRSARLARAA